MVKLAWDRLYVRNHTKSVLLLDRNKEDGLLTNDLLNEAIEKAIRQVSQDCNLIPVRWKFPLQANQWEYPMPEDLDRIRNVWYIDDTGEYEPLTYLTSDSYLDWEDPTETQTEPAYYSYPHYQGRVFQFYAEAPPVYDYVEESHVTTKSIRTVIDSGANFGKTLSNRIRPKCVVHNRDDGSYGYVEILDITTNKESGTATGGTTTTILEDTGKNFIAQDVQVGDIICTPSTGVVTSYAFVTAVAATQLSYADMEGSAKRFASSDTYKVGVATEIRLSMDTPHPGLRDGADNTFSVGDTKATITGTTFTDTTVSGSSTSGAETDDIAIASGGSHAKVTAVADIQLTVDKWIGGLPTDGETVTVKECDAYQIEDRYNTERVIWIGPTVGASDTVGSESIVVEGIKVPTVPSEDDDPLEVPQHYEQPLFRCSEWQARLLAGDKYTPSEILAAESVYRETVRRYRGDVWRPALNKPINPFRNRKRARHFGRRDQTRNGLAWDI